MKRKLAFVLCLALCAATLLGCGGSGTPSSSAQSQVTLRVYNWGDYIDPSVIESFETQYPNIKIQYDTFDSNESMLAKIEGGAEYDICFPSDYMVEKMVSSDMLAELDLTKIPNTKNMDSRFMNMDYDPDNKHSVPYMWGTVGILYNTQLVSDDVDSWNILWSSKYKGKVLMYDSVRDSVAAALKLLGYSVNTREQSQLDAAEQKLIEQKQQGIVKAYMTDNIKEAMIGGTYALALVYSGDAMYCMGENEDLAYAVPQEGSNIWTDNVVVLKTCKNMDAAYAFINYLCDADVAKLNTEYIGYSTPNEAAFEMLDESFKEDPAYNPPEDIVNRCEVYLDLGDEYTNIYNKIWEHVKLS